ncbi:hypothetical protein [Schlesneria sp. T3-172]|uniref:hypothetical protein n=1 Tax=Schlesneria sphaerica TaxID=3373610 RepID=UPI0037C6CA24
MPPKTFSQVELSERLRPIVESFVSLLAEQLSVHARSENKPAKLSTSEAASFIGITFGTLSGWRSQGRENQPRYYKTGSRVWYKKADLEKWIEANAHE